MSQNQVTARETHTKATLEVEMEEGEQPIVAEIQRSDWDEETPKGRQSDEGETKEKYSEYGGSGDHSLPAVPEAVASFTRRIRSSSHLAQVIRNERSIRICQAIQHRLCHISEDLRRRTEELGGVKIPENKVMSGPTEE
ncbi:GL15925 [Drosophila persimilis]|uniref:GL15925 n=1 Tax=Drosophila persimilis TaxID=7234 RepID=B4H0Q8_DROPE|nr:GL15925 [Drosophila persimilis]